MCRSLETECSNYVLYSSVSFEPLSPDDVNRSELLSPLEEKKRNFEDKTALSCCEMRFLNGRIMVRSTGFCLILRGTPEMLHSHTVEPVYHWAGHSREVAAWYRLTKDTDWACCNVSFNGVSYKNISCKEATIGQSTPFQERDQCKLVTYRSV